jgi:hypothetical protein
MTKAVRVASYRLRTTFGRQWAGLASLALLIGLIGGLALGALAGARRTQSSFPAYLGSTNPSDLTVLTALAGSGKAPGYDPALVAKIARLPHVEHVESYAGTNAGLLAPDGTVANNGVGAPGSIDGEYFHQDRVTIVEGRMPDPRRADEALVDAKGTPPQIHVGTVAPIGFFTNAQESMPDFGRGRVKPRVRIDIKIVGKAVFSSEVVQDDIDAGLDGSVVFTPALMRRLTRCCVTFGESALQLAGGSRDVAVVEQEIERALPSRLPVIFSVSSLTESKAERAIEPESIALGVFGGIAAVAAMLIAAQVVGRLLRARADDLATLRALGADPTMTVVDGLLGVVLAVLAGSVLAVGVAVELSPLSPLGTVRSVYPYKGIAFDWTVLGFGAVALAGTLTAVSASLAYRRAPHRTARRASHRGAGAARTAAASGLSAPAVEGIRLALDPGRGRTSVPVRSAIFGAALAMAVVVATVTFGASLDTLVSRPALYGWNWTYGLSAGNPTFVARDRAAALLDHDPDVAAWTGIYFGTLKIDGKTVPAIGADPNAPIAPPVLSGHGLEAANQVVLGAATLSQLHRHLGDTVALQGSGARPIRLRVVGTATLPSLGINATLHTEMGTGAYLAHTQLRRVLGGSPGEADGGPNEVLVRLRRGTNAAAERHRLQQLVPAGNGGEVSRVQRPAEIVNYRTMGSTPAWLGFALAAGAFVALGLTLVASVRRRRRDLALFKTLGFTRRQVAATVRWQASIAVALGILVGVPLGTIVGRLLWERFASAIYVVARPTVPVVTIGLIALGALVLANLVAAVPGRRASRTRTAELLRAE